MVAGQPHAASAWFPVNDHPTDKAAYTFRISAPRSLQVVANGSLTRRQNHGSFTTWTWSAGKPMASYLATIAIGHFKLTHHRTRGISYWDAIDSRLFRPVAAPRTGRQLAISQQADSSYKRLTRSIDVPAGGAQLSFWVNRNTEPDWDFFFVEAHTAGLDDWTTLADTNGHTTTGTGASCPVWLDLHPFLAHYQTARADGSCAASGSTGSWHAASGSSDGYENWVVDLSAYAGRTVEVSLSQASDDSVQVYGAFVDDVSRLHRPGHHVVRARRRHPGRVDDSRSRRPEARGTPTTGSSAPPRRHRRRRVWSPGRRCAGSPRSSPSCRATSAGTP